MSRPIVIRMDCRRAARAAFALLAFLLLPLEAALAKPAPDGFADLAAKLLPAVVNISSTQTIKSDKNRPEVPQLPPGSPFEDWFKDPQDRGKGKSDGTPPRRATS